MKNFFGSARKAILVGALGYFVDIYDLVLFSVVRVASLKDLGLTGEALLSKGVTLLNSQMLGMLVGGLLWGVLGDKFGRVRVLFGSILLYSVANLLNAFVQSVDSYILLRFIAGVGLAGELGAAITLVSEVLPQEKRGYGTALVAGVGLSGAIFAALVADFFTWRVTYFTGGSLGLLLLLSRLKLMDSSLFSHALNHAKVPRGSLRQLFLSGERLRKFLDGILIGVPIWYCVGILVTFAPEIGKALGINEPLSSAKGILFTYMGISLGDVLTGFASQWLKSRKKVVLACMLLELLLVLTVLFTAQNFDAWYFYVLCFLLGLATGYWAVFVTIAAEQFGTNLRATVATSTPNFVRGSVVLLTLSFNGLKNYVSIPNAALTVGLVSIGIALVSLFRIEETFHRDLDFFEE